jgi:inorganic triphosphatase YgiF
VNDPAPETFREVERKLRVHGLYRLPDLAEVAGSGVASVRQQPRLTLRATYFDTGDLRLARSRITLRRREGGVDDGWHLKLPVDGGAEGRDEVRLPLTEDKEPPETLQRLVVAVTRGAPLEAVATLETDRAPVELVAADGRLLAELTDDSVSVLDGSHVAARFRELEVETREATPDEVAAVVDALVASGAIEGGLPSKAVRALGPAAMAPPDVPEEPEVGPDDPAGSAIRAYLARHTAAFLTQDLRVRRDLPDAVHQMRVAARRIRSGLKVFAPLVEPDWADGLRGELAWIAAELGEMRDREVLEERLLTHLAELPAVAPDHDGQGTAGVDRTDTRDVAAAMSVVRRVFDEELARAATRAADAMGSERYVALVESLVAAARSPLLTPAADVPCRDALPPLLADAWRTLRKRAKRLDLGGTDESWHRARISAKRARYAAEALVPVLGDDARRTARMFERVTELLGEHQDAVIAADTTRRLASGRRVTGTTGFVLGLLHERERTAVTAARHGFVDLWPRVASRRTVGWLAG